VTAERRPLRADRVLVGELYFAARCHGRPESPASTARGPRWRGPRRTACRPVRRPIFT